MRNKDLIELLQKRPPEATVWVTNAKGSAYGVVTLVETTIKESVDANGKVTHTQIDIHLDTNI